MFADVHSHVLYGIDDGARSVKEMQLNLQLLRRGGVTHLALTPHYYPYKGSIRSFLERRDRAFQTLKILPEAQNFTFTLGSEVYLGETLFNNESLLPLCYEGTRFMLTELEYATYFTDAAKYRLLRLIDDFNIVPVLAHIDRYPFLWRDMKVLKDLKRMGCRFQVNLSALRGCFSRWRAIKLFENGYVDFLGEDVHHTVYTVQEKEKFFSRVKKRNGNFLQTVTDSAVTRLFQNLSE